MFPIWDARGEPVGFGGRTLDAPGPEVQEHRRHARCTRSRRLLYGLQLGEGRDRRAGRGRDLRGLHRRDGVRARGRAERGRRPAAPRSPTSTSSRSRTSPARSCLAYDADGAGQAAAERCYQWEQRYEVQFQVADLEAGRDPADVWRVDPEALVSAVKGATPFLEFRIERALAAADLSTFEGRAPRRERVAAMIVEHPNDLVRDQYVMQSRGSARHRARSPARRRSRSARNRPHTEPARREPQPPTAAVVDRRELDALRWAVQAPELMSGRLTVDLFSDPIARKRSMRSRSGRGTSACSRPGPRSHPCCSDSPWRSPKRALHQRNVSFVWS